MALVRLAVAALLALAFSGVAGADLVVDEFTAFGTIENCSYGASIDGDYAAVVDDEGPSPLHYYHFPTKTLHDVGLPNTVWVYGASMSDMKIAYLYSEGWSSTGYQIAVYDIVTGTTIHTGVTTAERWDSYLPMRFFDKDRVAFVDRADGHIKYYSISSDAVTDTGLTGWDPTIDGDVIAFSAPIPGQYRQYDVTLYDLNTKASTVIDTGSMAVVAGEVVAYIAATGEAKYYRIDSGNLYPTGLVDVDVLSTDGRRIAISSHNRSIKVYDISTGEIEDTGAWPCSGTSPCWIEIGGPYVAFERYEGGSWIYGPEGRIDLYPETDLNNDGFSTQDCAGGWILSAIPTPLSEVEDLLEEVLALDLSGSAEGSLTAELDVAVKTLKDANEKNDAAASNVLEAFLNKVEAQRGTQLTAEEADALAAEARSVLELL